MLTMEHDREFPASEDEEEEEEIGEFRDTSICARCSLAE